MKSYKRSLILFLPKGLRFKALWLLGVTPDFQEPFGWIPPICAKVSYCICRGELRLKLGFAPVRSCRIAKRRSGALLHRGSKVARIRKAVEKRDQVTLDQDGIISEELQIVMHAPPSEAHLDRAAEAVGLDRNLVPHCATVAELLAFVLSVQAAGGNDKAISAILDRFSPKASRTSTDINVSSGGSPVASSSPEEAEAAASYMRSLMAVP
jgi:hypothetical protein